MKMRSSIRERHWPVILHTWTDLTACSQTLKIGCSDSADRSLPEYWHWTGFEIFAIKFAEYNHFLCCRRPHTRQSDPPWCASKCKSPEPFSRIKNTRCHVVFMFSDNPPPLYYSISDSGANHRCPSTRHAIRFRRSEDLNLPSRPPREPRKSPELSRTNPSRYRTLIPQSRDWVHMIVPTRNPI